MDRLYPRIVRLIKDLTAYDKRLKIGEVGVTTGGRSGYANLDHFCEVQFNNGAVAAIAFSSLEVIEQKQNTEKPKKQKRRKRISKMTENEREFFRLMMGREPEYGERVEIVKKD